MQLGKYDKESSGSFLNGKCKGKKNEHNDKICLFKMSISYCFKTKKDMLDIKIEPSPISS